jgi:hypothetical protein
MDSLLSLQSSRQHAWVQANFPPPFLPSFYSSAKNIRGRFVPDVSVGKRLARAKGGEPNRNRRRAVNDFSNSLPLNFFRPKILFLRPDEEGKKQIFSKKFYDLRGWVSRKKAWFRRDSGGRRKKEPGRKKRATENLPSPRFRPETGSL